jgi:hypothetical protein
MAEIGYGYGSEFQLLRFLGHHRIEFENIIRENTLFKDNFQWLDFPYDSHRISMDGEYNGISFLEDRKDFSDLKNKWINFWPNSGNQQNWDAIFIHNDEYVLIEAKAHLKEIESNISTTNEKSIKMIQSSFDLTRKHFNIITQNDWTIKYYQLANRLAFLKFLIDNNIKAHLLNIYFINGYIKRCYEDKRTIIENKSVESKQIWEDALTKQYDFLGIWGREIEKYLISIFVNCKK